MSSGSIPKPSSGSASDVHPSAIGSNTKPPTRPSGLDTASRTTSHRADTKEQDQNPEASDNSGVDDEGYPPQLHAGKVGYGPNYNQKAGFLDKAGGLKEELIGKIKHDQDMIQHGHDRATGELKRKEQEADMEENPFRDPEEKQEEKQEGDSE